MLRNIFKISIRYLIKQKGYAFINIFGLAFGLATCILIFLFIQHELSYDRFHEQAGNIVRVEPRWVGMGEDSHWASTQGSILPSLVSRFPEIRHAVKIHFNYQPSIVEHGDIIYSEEGIMIADSSFFDVFSFKLLQGDPDNALSGKAKLILTEDYAKKYFGDGPALNKILRIDNTPYKVSGIVQNIPDNSHFHFNIAISLDDMRSKWDGVDREGPSAFYSYLRVADKASLKQLSRKANEQVWEIHGFDTENDTTGIMQDYDASLIFRPITGIHLNGHAEKEIEANSNKKYIYIFSSIALFVLLIACINYMNLATARSSRRAREVGLRKVMGARKSNIFNQFMLESFLLCLTGMLFGLIMVEIILPAFNHMTGKNLSLNIFENPVLLISLTMIIILVSFAAGAYPSIYLARLDPMRILRSGTAASKANKPALYLRRLLVVSQFSISVVLIIGTITVYRQLHFIQNKSLGFDKDPVLVVNIPAFQYRDKISTLKDELKSNPFVLSSSLISGIPGQRMPFLTVSLPDVPFSYFFLDTYYDNLYRSEANMGTIITYFAILAIIIACLGLFGLASYITEQRTREIGIRKILGASVGSIIRSLSLEFMVLVIISNIIAWVPAWLLMNNWLDDFAYRTAIGFWVFVLAAISSFIIAFTTISFQSVRAARTNPVNAIKYE
ncbi:MAG: FtsX-like permease family protein [Bacteroidales bacterium]|nr:FtsX-like permease family protein [Bacteroidales bacterium]